MTELSSDDMLDLLASIGRPHLMRHDSGKWVASLEFPAPAGVTAKISSDHNMPTHRAALAQVISRIKGLSGLSENASKALARIGGA